MIDWKLKDISEIDDEVIENLSYQIQDGEGFWYAITEGYIDPSRIINDKEQIVKLQEALQIIHSFENVCEEIAEDYYNEEDEEDE